MFCRNCGSEINDNATFCSNCGVKVVEDTNTINANNTNMDSNNVTTNTINTPNTNTTDYNNSNYSNNSYNNYNNYNNIPHNTNNKNNTKIIIIIAVVVLFLVILIGGGIFIANKIKLAIVDKIAQVEAQNINDIFNDTENTIDINDVFDDTENTLDIEVAPGVEIITEEEKSYSVGDSVELVDGSKWHIVSVDGDNVVLLSDTLALESSAYGRTGSSEDQKYENSLIKEYLENTYLPTLKSNLENKSADTINLSVRLLTLDEILELTNAKWVGSTDDIKLSTYSVYKSDIGDDFDWLSMTSSYWLQDYIVSEENNGFFYGAYYVKVRIDDEMPSFSNLSIEADDCGDAWASDRGGNLFGVRPVIETTIENIK